MSNNVGAHALPGAALMASAVYAHADNADTTNIRNNPLNLVPDTKLQDDYTPSFYDTHAHTHDVLVHGTLPNAPGDFIPLGVGGGNVWKSASNILNAFVEPQWTVDAKAMA